MSIIPSIPRPSISPNRSGETRYDSDLRVTASEYIYGIGDFIRLFWAGNNRVNEVRVEGTVWAESTSNVSAAFAGFNVQNYLITGTVVAQASASNSEYGQGNAYAVSNSGNGGALYNSGSIYAITDTGIAIGFSNFGGSPLNNSGIIAAQSANGSETVAAQALAVSLTNGGIVHNQVSGQILAEGDNAVALSLGQALNPNILLGRPDVRNDGVIRAVSLGGSASVGIAAGVLPHQTFQIENNGLIEAEVAIRTGSSVIFGVVGAVNILNGNDGRIIGDIESDGGTQIIRNLGYIEGTISFGSGDDVVNSFEGRHLGRVSLGTGRDEFIGGISDERVDGGRGYDDLSGEAGNDLLFGGFGNDRLDGGAGNDGLYGDYGDDSFVIAGADSAFGGQGTDVFELRALDFAMIDGGIDNDTLTIGAISSLIDLGAAFETGRIIGIETIDLQSTGRAALAAANLDADLNGLHILGSSGAQFQLVGQWALSGATVVDDLEFSTYTSAGISIHVQTGVDVGFVDTMPAEATGLDSIAGGENAPTLADEPAIVPQNPVWRGAAFSVDGDLIIGSYETWITEDGRPSGYSIPVLSADDLEATVINNGHLLAGEDPVTPVRLDTLELFINNGTIAVANQDEGITVRAFRTTGSVPLFNHGSIIAIADNGIQAVAATVRARNGEPNQLLFDNTGDIRAEAPQGTAIGAYLLTGHIAINSGEITAVGEDWAVGLFIDQRTDLRNSGTISVEFTGDTATGPGAAIYYETHFWRQFLTNSGEISGPVAIRVEYDEQFEEDPFFPTDPFDISRLFVTNEQSGIINGDVITGYHFDHITNLGIINGAVSLGRGDDFLDSRNGVLNGDILAGDGVDFVFAGRGDHVFDGGSSVDTFAVSGDFADYSITQTDTGVFEVVGADGRDTLINTEFLQFDDRTIRLIRGEGVAVDFETSDPGTYQAAMNAIRDFDGNNLGGEGAWLRIGSADVNGDGDIDQILVNDAIGRFATVGTDANGFAYFDDYSWAGETRVAGIYIDPLVHFGQVVAGSDEDSQRRFQNDLQIENINRVLGADDYDGDGIWEVYLGLTDGTAYLRALMHADGNIRYANYQSEQEVIDYLTANGFGEETFGDWFPSSQEEQSAKELAQVEVTAVPLTLELAQPVSSPTVDPAEALTTPHGFEPRLPTIEDPLSEFFG